MDYEIVGAKGKFEDVEGVIDRLKNLGEKYNVTLQLIDARLIFGKAHLDSAVFHAQRAMAKSTNLAKSIAVEIILYASGERQIGQAITKMGIKSDTEEFGLIIYDLPSQGASEEGSKLCGDILSELDLVRDDTILEGDKSVLERFGITKEELEAVSQSHWSNLILERVAMVDIIK
ncbi:MAG: hypothetical protein JSV49_03340 [Thermoplasmata archaeon]|nr:MAG: hypothetical protein JSV49_03340 [Thermoplasmata archaeon]